MKGPALTVGPETTLLELRRIFVENRIHGVPVADREGRMLGIVSSSDLLASGLDTDDPAQPRPAAIDYLSELLEYSPEDTRDLTSNLAGGLGGRTVGDVMTENAATVDIDAPVHEAARTLTERRIHRVVVVEHGRVCGIISSLDLVAVLAKSS